MAGAYEGATIWRECGCASGVGQRRGSPGSGKMGLVKIGVLGRGPGRRVGRISMEMAYIRRSVIDDVYFNSMSANRGRGDVESSQGNEKRKRRKPSFFKWLHDSFSWISAKEGEKRTIERIDHERKCKLVALSTRSVPAAEITVSALYVRCSGLTLEITLKTC